MTGLRWLMVMTENDAIVDPRDIAALVDLAVVAEANGIDGAMVSDHVLLGRSAGVRGVMGNQRDYAAPGNQDPSTPWPSNIVLMSAMAQATSTLRIVSGAVIAPLRHPLLLAKELGTLDLLSRGRLVVLPTVSWHEDEYAALGVPFAERGAITRLRRVSGDRTTVRRRPVTRTWSVRTNSQPSRSITRTSWSRYPGPIQSSASNQAR